MSENPYSPPTSAPKVIFVRDLPKAERRRKILAGETTAGVLVVQFYKHPIRTAIICITVPALIFVGCWNLL